MDKNKIKHIGELSFAGQMMRLSELHIEENRLKDLSNLHICRGLHKLYAANNKISEFYEIDRLMELNHLLEISLINNPVIFFIKFKKKIIKIIIIIIIIIVIIVIKDITATALSNHNCLSFTTSKSIRYG